MKKILVVGGTGFIGYHVIERAKKKNWKIYSVSLNKPKKNRYHKGESYILADLTNYKSLKNNIRQDFDYVVNAGGYGKKTVFNSHFLGVLNLIKTISKKKLKKFVQIGSSAEYGNIKAPQAEKFKCYPNSPYGLAKFASTCLLKNLYITEKYPATILRFFLVYGPKQERNRILPQVIEGSIKDRRFPLTKGNQYCDFCYIDDVVEAIFKTITSKKTNGEIINIGSGKARKIREVVNLICKIIGKGKPQFGKIKYEKNSNMKLYPNLKKAEKILKWQSNTKLIDGLKFTISSYINS